MSSCWPPKCGPTGKRPVVVNSCPFPPPPIPPPPGCFIFSPTGIPFPVPPMFFMPPPPRTRRMSQSDFRSAGPHPHMPNHEAALAHAQAMLQHTFPDLHKKMTDNGQLPNANHHNGKLPLPRHPQLYKTVLCDFFMHGQPCDYGDTCWFAHGEHELRRPSENNPHRVAELARGLGAGRQHHPTAQWHGPTVPNAVDAHMNVEKNLSHHATPRAPFDFNSLDISTIQKRIQALSQREQIAVHTIMMKLGVRPPSPVDFAANNDSVFAAESFAQESSAAPAQRRPSACELGPIGSGRPSAALKLPDIGVIAFGQGRRSADSVSSDISSGCGSGSESPANNTLETRDDESAGYASEEVCDMYKKCGYCVMGDDCMYEHRREL